MKSSERLAELTSIVSTRPLAPEEIRDAASALVDATVGDDHKIALLRAWTERGETAAELAACAEAFLPHAFDPGVRGSWNGKPLLDCSGTGGGGLPILNISTGIMFVLAVLGVPVVKHGNRALTKSSGSADVLESLGIRIDLPPEKNQECLEQVGCVFLFAPAYHPSFAAVAAARRQLGAEGRRTIFNLLGPLLNPARPDARMVGVFKREHAYLYEQALQALGCPRFTVVCGKDRATDKMLGEASANGETFVRTSVLRGDGAPQQDLSMVAGAESRTGQEVSPFLFSVDSLLVSDASESAHRIEAVLRGEEKSFAFLTLLFNAAVAAWTAGAASSWEEGMVQCREALESGRAYEVLERWRKFSERSR